MLQRKVVNEFVYIDVTKLYDTVLNLYSVSIGVAFGIFWCSAHFAQPMSDNYTSPYCSPSLVHLCNNSPASSTCIVSYIGGQYSRTVPNVDIVGSTSRCHTRHLTTGGVARFYFYFVLAPNSNPVMTLPTTWTVVLEYLVQVVASWGHSLYGKRKRKRRRFRRRSFRHVRPYTKTGLTKTKTFIVFSRRVQAAQVWFVLRIPAQARVSKWTLHFYTGRDMVSCDLTTVLPTHQRVRVVKVTKVVSFLLECLTFTTWPVDAVVGKLEPLRHAISMFCWDITSVMRLWRHIRYMIANTRGVHH
jgi:hypothetical protein